MAGSWEIQEANQVVVGLLHVDVTTISWSFGLRNLIVPGDESLRRFDPFVPLAGMPFDHARDTACQIALSVGAQWIYFYDSDIVPPRNAIIRLMSHRKPIISGVYCRRSPPAGVPVMIRNSQWITSYPPNTLIEADYVGAGMLLIHRTVLESLPVNPARPEKRWFDWKVNCAGLEPAGECLSEDFTFCVRARRELGIPTIVYTGCQALKHIGYGEASYGSFKPLEVTVRT